MAEYDQVNSGGLLGPELTTQVGIKGRQAGDDIASRVLKFAAGAEATPPEQLTGGGTKAPEVKPMHPLELPGRASRGGYPITSESRFTGGESSIGPEYTGDQPAIPERGTITAPETPKGYTNYAPGIDYKLGAENKAGDVSARANLNAGYNDMRRTTEGEMRGVQEDKRRARDIEEGTSGDFDFSTYKKAMEQIGGKPSEKMRADILSHMFTAHGRKQELAQKMKELGMTEGEGSPRMIAAKSEAKFREIQGQNALNLAPHEITKTIQETAHIRAQTEAIPFDVAYKKSMAEYHQSLIEAKAFTNESAYLKILAEKIEKGLPGDPEVVKAQKEFDQVVDNKRGQMMVERAERNNPKLKGKVGWKNGQYFEIGT
jgi:hypothetical protein